MRKSPAGNRSVDIEADASASIRKMFDPRRPGGRSAARGEGGASSGGKCVLAAVNRRFDASYVGNKTHRASVWASAKPLLLSTFFFQLFTPLTAYRYRAVNYRDELQQPLLSIVELTREEFLL